ncbi:hypothetical protein J5N58_01180 [Rhizobium cremeum]|uniref:hypothetical protein n=1 Tax=Rhizobium cremeum TaxID=2813827 RepID=UPI001FD16EE0|nr:hypothetical protein [Rhizobium cremeum]MCJ7993209.1 hypothetical protein [Rhizobium cremeum]MCJ7998274.1 hypothetical protein [Rhizobium cremeum]
MFDIVLMFFALVGVGAVIFLIVSKIAGGSPLERDWRQAFAKTDMAAKDVFARRIKPHDNRWHLDYDREFSRAVSGLFGEGAMKQFRDEGVLALPMIFHLLAHIPDDLLDAFWRYSRETADKAKHEDSGEAVLWDLVWLFLGGEQFSRMAQNEGQKTLAMEMQMRVGSLLKPGSLKVDNILVSS